MILRSQLAWLWGYPLKLNNNDQAHTLQWRSLYLPTPWEVSTHTINGLSLSSAIYSRNILRGDYPKALARVVNDTEQWSEHVELKINTIKQLLAGQLVNPLVEIIQPLLSRRDYQQILTTLRCYPQFEPLIQQFAWWISADTQQFKTAIQWINNEAIHLQAIQEQISHTDEKSEDIILKLFALHQKIGGSACQNILHITSSPEWHSIARPRVSLFMEEAINEKYQCTFFKKKRRNNAPKNLSLLMSQWLGKTLALPKRQCQLRMRIVNFCLPKVTIDAYSEYWRVLDKIPKLNHKHSMQKNHKKSWQFTPKSVIKKERETLLLEIVEYELPHFASEMLTSMFTWFSQNPKIFQSLEALIKAIKIDQLPADSPWHTPHLTLYFALAWYRSFHNENAGYLQKLAKHLTTLVHFIKTDPSDEKQYFRLSIFEDALDYQSHNLLISQFYYHNNLEKFLSKIDHFCTMTEKPLTQDFILYVKNIYDDKVNENWHNIARYMHTLIQKDISFCWIDDTQWIQFDTIAQGDIGLFLQSLERWGTLDKNEHDTGLTWEELEPDLLPIATLLFQYGLIDIANYFADKKEYFHLEPLLQLKSIAYQSKDALIKPYLAKNPSNEWISAYPDALQAELNTLNQYHRLAPHIAEKCLSADIPSTQKLQQEIDTLDKIIQEKQSYGIDHEALSKRRDKQYARLSTPMTLSNNTLAKLTTKLRHTTYLHTLEQWQQDIENYFQEKIINVFELGELPADSLGHPRHKKALIYLLNLPLSVQNVAKTILQTRLSSKPWDLRHEENNQDFLTLLTAQGINPEPWLNGMGKQNVSITDHQKNMLELSIEFEDDPLEIFQMGSYFNTCLSVGSFNYFSVVANIADINKRIVYIKQDGKVVGRCLFALNNQGHLLSFHLYSHLKDGTLDQIMNDFTDQLAKAMNTTRSDQGHVATLVATDWYNDGVVEFKNKSPNIINDSLANELLTLPLVQAHQRIKALCSQVTLATIQSLLSMPVFQQRPELSIALVDQVQHFGHQYQPLHYLMAKHLLACHEKGLALRVLKMISFYQTDYSGYHYYCGVDEEELELLLKISPSLVHRALKRSRNSGMKDHKDDNEIHRLKAFIRVYEKLYRPQQILACQQRIDQISKK